MLHQPVPKDREEARRFVLQAARDYDVKFIRLWFTDILGFLKSFAITIAELERALEEGMGFDGSSIEGFTRIEYRSPDPACNPYLTFSVMLAAGMEGMEKGYQLPEPVEANVFEMSPAERERQGIGTIPGSLWEAISLTESSTLARRSLGEHVFANLLANKRIEWDRYRTQVTEYELKNTLRSCESPHPVGRMPAERRGVEVA